MMNITILCFEKSKKDALNAISDEYYKRIPWTITTKIAQAKQPILQKYTASPLYTIILDGTGKELSSKGFADYLDKLQQQGTRDICFMIGGANGLDKKNLSYQDSLSFGKLTWPHRFVRVMLAEQLYRAYTIMTHHPYHK